MSTPRDADIAAAIADLEKLPPFPSPQDPVQRATLDRINTVINGYRWVLTQYAIRGDQLEAAQSKVAAFERAERGWRTDERSLQDRLSLVRGDLERSTSRVVDLEQSRGSFAELAAERAERINDLETERDEAVQHRDRAELEASERAERVGELDAALRRQQAAVLDAGQKQLEAQEKARELEGDVRGLEDAVRRREQHAREIFQENAARGETIAELRTMLAARTHTVVTAAMQAKSERIDSLEAEVRDLREQLDAAHAEHPNEPYDLEVRSMNRIKQTLDGLSTEQKVRVLAWTSARWATL